MKFLLLRDGNPSKEDKKPVFTSYFFPIESFKEKSIIQKLSFIFSSGNEHSMLNTMKETILFQEKITDLGKKIDKIKIRYLSDSLRFY